MLVEALFDRGQTILVSKLFDDQNYSPMTDEPDELKTLLQLATERLKPKTLEILKAFISKHKKLPRGQLELIMPTIKK